MGGAGWNVGRDDPDSMSLAARTLPGQIRGENRQGRDAHQDQANRGDYFRRGGCRADNIGFMPAKVPVTIGGRVGRGGETQTSNGEGEYSFFHGVRRITLFDLQRLNATPPVCYAG